MEKLICAFFITIFSVIFPVSNDVTNNIEYLGQPFSKAIYACNVWDMQLYNNRIYLGHGNSSNRGPSPNAGTDGVIYYDIMSEKFINEFKVDEEQIDIYKVLDGKLYIPGHDSTQSWDYGNYYELSDNTWKKFRNIPNGIHVYDMELYENNIFAGLGTSRETVVASDDNGQSWRTFDDMLYLENHPRMYSLFQLNGKLYASSIFYKDSVATQMKLLCIEKNNNNSEGLFTRSIVIAEKMIPDMVNNKYFKIVKPSMFNSNLLYILGEIYNDHQFLPAGLYYATDINSAKHILLPDSESLPVDILIRDKSAYVLAYIKNEDLKYTNIVYTTIDGENFVEVLRFTQETFARSFEEVNGDFYFGLGCNTDLLSESTGSILRIKSEAYKKNDLLDKDEK